MPEQVEELSPGITICRQTGGLLSDGERALAARTLGESRGSPCPSSAVRPDDALPPIMPVVTW